MYIFFILFDFYKYTLESCRLEFLNQFQSQEEGGFDSTYQTN